MKFLTLCMFFLCFFYSSHSLSKKDNDVENSNRNMKLYADNPDQYYENVIKYGLHVEPLYKISSALYKGIDNCLMEAKKIKPKEALVEWEHNPSNTAVSVYEGDINYLFSFYTEGDAGGGMVCFVSKNNNKVIWIEPQY